MYKKTAYNGNLIGTPSLIDELDQTDPLRIIAKKINWMSIEDKLSEFYSFVKGKFGLPIRLLASLIILRQLEGLTDVTVGIRWKRDRYYQAFSGQKTVTDKLPCDPSTLSVFRKKIGEAGIKIIFDESVNIFGNKALKELEEEVITDTTVQPKYTAFPTDINLAEDVIHKIWKTAKNNSIKLRNKHKKEVNKLVREAAFNKSNKKDSIKAKILKRLREIGLLLLDELTKKLPIEVTTSIEFKLLHDNYYKALTQAKNDKDKIYSIYEPQIYCVCKGKVHVKYEFGTKVAMIAGRSGIIFAIQSMDNNVHDSRTIQPLLDNLNETYGIAPSIIIGDYGYRGRKYYGSTTVVTPIKDIDKLSDKDKKEHIRRMNDRSSIEQIFSHLKNDFGLGRNMLKGRLGDRINPIIAAAVSNFALYARKEQLRLKKIAKNTLNKKKIGISKLIPIENPKFSFKSDYSQQKLF
jgi:IS5 family transposase